MPVRSSPVQIGSVLGDFNNSQVLAFGAVNPEAFWPCYPNISMLITLHSIGDAAFDRAIAYVFCKTLSVIEASVMCDLVNIN